MVTCASCRLRESLLMVTSVSSPYRLANHYETFFFCLKYAIITATTNPIIKLTPEHIIILPNGMPCSFTVPMNNIFRATIIKIAETPVAKPIPNGFQLVLSARIIAIGIARIAGIKGDAIISVPMK
jgi:hypothetical protein